MSTMTRKQKRSLYRIILATLALALLKLLELPTALSAVVYLATYLLIGRDIISKAVKGVIRGQVFDENFLMAIATVGAIALAVFDGSFDFSEAVVVMLVYQIGELFESYAVGKSRRSISELMDIRPDYANTERDGKLVQLDPSEVCVGDSIYVRPGERIPIDGVILEGVSALNTSALTGESLPKDVCAGDEIISGCINLTAPLTIRTTKNFEDSTVSKILELVENSASRKSKTESFISRFAHFYTPAVCYAALALAVLPPLLSLLFGVPAQWSTWLYRALTFLVISCPCALVISIPLSFFAGIGGAGREGVLIKGSNYLEILSQVKAVAFDKTGTLSKGVFEVVEIRSVKLEKNMLLELAAHAEAASSHPISQSLIRAYGIEPDRRRVTDICEYAGKGLTARVDGMEVATGNAKLMADMGIAFEPCNAVGTVIYIAIDGEYAGYILISDLAKPNAGIAIRELKRAGVRKTVILTGDSDKAARKFADEIGVKNVHSELLPADKTSIVEKLLQELTAGEKLAFVGDGINDAPVLARADIGIAMGAMGSDAAIEAADIVLMDDDPMKLVKAIKISRKCLKIVRENIVFALGIKLICLLLGALGLANMWLAIFADVGVMVIAVLNAIRALRI